MAVERWTAGSGVGLTWTEVIGGTQLNALANNSSALTFANVVTNGTALDIFADFSIAIKAGGTTAAPNFIGVYLYPLNQDGTTYGDNTLTSGTQTAAITPSATYWVGNIIVPTGITTGNFVYGELNRIILPPGSFLWVIQNQLGVATASDTTSSCKYRTYNRSIS